ncbi:hypothetical protein [Kitasatospora sp. NPDC002040]|uniref:hypothetical protein n=1 Tax=Kitasatospora sp. NPDC002040 TaxID=3154661 RepID=UPI0033261650
MGGLGGFIEDTANSQLTGPVNAIKNELTLFKADAKVQKHMLTGLATSITGLKSDFTAVANSNTFFKADLTALALGFTVFKADYSLLKVDEKGVYWRGKPVKQWGVDKIKQLEKNTEKAQREANRESQVLNSRLRTLDQRISALSGTKDQRDTAKSDNRKAWSTYSGDRTEENLRKAQEAQRKYQELDRQVAKELREIDGLKKRAEKSKDELKELRKVATDLEAKRKKLKDIESDATKAKATTERLFGALEQKAQKLETKLNSLSRAIG